jgi:MarR family transcriptional regulator, organic hydroperoxide resistance regulator
MAIKKISVKAAPSALTDQLDFLIRDTRLRLYKSIETRIARSGLPLRLWFPLRALYQNEGMTQRELGRILGFGDARAGVIVALMQRRQLLYRQPSRTDKRRINLYLTPGGRETARLTLRHMRAVEAQLTSGFSAAETRALKALLFRAHENLKAP